MVTKYIIMACALLSLTMMYGCPKPCLNPKYDFAINAYFSPEKDSIHVGDTLFLFSSTPFVIKDINTGMEVNYSNAKNINSTLYADELVQGQDTPVYAVKDFTFFAVSGRVFTDNTIPSPDRVKQLIYEESQGNYELNIGIIPNKKGVYSLWISDGLSLGRANKNSCEKAIFIITLSDTNQHIYYYKNWRPNYNSTGYEAERMYCFKVY